MRSTLLSLIFILAMGLLFGCASPQDKAYEAQEKLHKERLELIEQYQECIKKAGDDEKKKETCEQYLKAAEALK